MKVIVFDINKKCSRNNITFKTNKKKQKKKLFFLYK